MYKLVSQQQLNYWFHPTKNNIETKYFNLKIESRAAEEGPKQGTIDTGFKMRGYLAARSNCKIVLLCSEIPAKKTWLNFNISLLEET